MNWKLWLILVIVLMFIFLIAYGLTPDDWKNFNILTQLDFNEAKPKKTVTKRNSSMEEEYCRRLIEEIFPGHKFPSVNRTKETWFQLKWLYNDRTNHPLELDGYCKELGIAFEFQGPQHYEYIPGTFHSTLADFENQVYCDRRKSDLCANNGVWLIIIPYHIPKNKRKEYIQNRLPGKSMYLPK